LWAVVRRKRWVIVMMAKSGESLIFDLDKNRIKEREMKEQQEQNSSKISRFIIPPDNFWYRQWNNSMLLVYVIYLSIMPINVSHNYRLSEEDMRQLYVYDAIFMIDRVLDLFVSFYNPNGKLEHKFHSVILNNISFKLFLEAFISIGPQILNPNRLAMIYGLFKITRYGRLFEMDGIISTMIEIQAQTKTVFEVK
jgi:hypothetical protein